MISSKEVMMGKTKEAVRIWRPETSARQRVEARIGRARGGNRRSLRALAEWLSSGRGLEQSTIATRIHEACHFVDAVTARSRRPCAVSFRLIDAKTIEDLFVELCRDRGYPSRRALQTAMRSVLQFAAHRGWIDQDLVAAVPSLVSYRLSHVPKGLSDRQLGQLLDRPFQRGKCPRRDWAIVSLLATYGARRGQISALSLGDVDWQEQTIELAAHKGGKTVRHALTGAVAQALAAYLHDERPQSRSTSLFLRHPKPHVRLSPCAITEMMRQRMVRRGLEPCGPHRLRHTFATRLLRAGQPVKTIADLLGHRSLASVGIYAKVDVERLLTVALEWPEVSQ